MPEGRPCRDAWVREMCSLMRHRGPDDQGTWHEGPVGLGHQRLSIIDLSELGKNPMPNEDQSVWVVFNGEIYNHLELRRELESQGHHFRSRTDTEVLVHLFEEQGPKMVEKLNGMFAFAIWDQAGRRLMLARDRFGVKPLYYTDQGGSFAFASEAKAFLALPWFEARPDPLALAEHFTFQNTFDRRTLFENVNMLPAGHYLLYEDGRQSLRQYWDLCFDPQEGQSLDHWAGGLRERFETSVVGQLMSDVPLGSYLSGGMDTGSICAVGVKKKPGMHTFTCGFDIPAGASDLEVYFDESRESCDLAQLLGTVHHKLLLGPDAMPQVLAKVVWHLDEPRVGISYQVYLMAEVIRRHVTVVLSGVGGDELFAGYPWRYLPVLDEPLDRFEESYYRASIRFLDDEEKKWFFSDDVLSQVSGYSSFDRFREMSAPSRGMDPLHRALYFDFKTFLNGLLIVDDKLSMAHSVEARVPFLDNDLVEYVSRMPSSLKLAHGNSKVVLKRAMRGLLPEDTLQRRKQGFTPPDQTWYKGPLLEFIRETICGRRALQRGYFRPEGLERVLDDHLQGRRNNRFLIWSLLSFEWWNRLFVDRDPLPVSQGAD